jgi:hypothetical protein
MIQPLLVPYFLCETLPLIRPGNLHDINYVVAKRFVLFILLIGDLSILCAKKELLDVFVFFAVGVQDLN